MTQKTDILLTDAEDAIDRALGDYGSKMTALIGIGKAMIAIAQELKRMNDRADNEIEREDSLKKLGPNPELGW